MIAGGGNRLMVAQFKLSRSRAFNLVDCSGGHGELFRELSGEPKGIAGYALIVFIEFIPHKSPSFPYNFGSSPIAPTNSKTYEC